MRLSDAEMMFMISVSKGRKPLGIGVKMPENKEREAYVQNTVCSLREKGIVNENMGLTKEGADLLYFFEIYRNNHRHVVLDQVYVAVLPKNRLITVERKESSYEFSCISTAVLLEALLGYSEFLNSHDEHPRRGSWESITARALTEKVQSSTGGVWIREYIEGVSSGEKYYGWDMQQGYVVNLEKNRIRSLSPSWMRKQICRLLTEEG